MIMSYILLNINLARWSLQLSFLLHMKLGRISILSASVIEMLPMPLCFIYFLHYTTYLKYTAL